MQHTIFLSGHGVRLEPLQPKHLDQIRCAANDPQIWAYTFGDNPFLNDQDAQRWLATAQDDPSMQPFVIFDERTGALAGTTRYMEIVSEHRKLEIGWTFLARSFWRSHVNTAAKFLLLRYAFEQWAALRVQFKAEAVNERSRRAILRLGATHEGTLRNFRIKPNGEVRDTAFYSIVAIEWPMVKERLLSFLDQSLYNLEAG